MIALILTILKNQVTGIQLQALNIYVSFQEKQECWNSIKDLKEKYDLDKCILGGDFNFVLDRRENKGGDLVCDPLQEVVEYIMEEWDLLDA